MTMSGNADFDPFGIQQEQQQQPANGASSANEAGQEKLADKTTKTTPVADDSDPFDPFGIGTFPDSAALAAEATTGDESKTTTTKPAPPATTNNIPPPPQVSRVTRTKSGALPPKVMVKLTMHEEATSKAGNEAEGSSEVAVEGSIFAQVQCSDARKNSPFTLRLLPPDDDEADQQVTWRPNAAYATKSGDNELTVDIPKQEIGYVPVAYYSVTNEVEHLPVLLERKVTVHEKSCRIAVQVRSKLTNKGDMEDFAIAVAVPERIDGTSVEVLRGEGEWDGLKRTIQWKLASLNKGESFMVSAQASLWKELADQDDVAFPVLLRCTSAADQISTVALGVAPTEGYPAAINSQTTHSFRLLHRLS